MIRTLIALQTITLCLSLSACGSVPLRREEVSSRQLNEGLGIVLVSVASLDKGKCMSFATDLAIRDADSGKSVRVLLVNNPFSKSDFPNYLGHVYAAALAPGEYAFWIQQVNGFFHYGDGHVGESFRVAAGEIKYLGDFWLAGCGDVRYGFRDNWANVRDTFTKTYPQLPLDSARAQIVRTNP